MQAPYEWTVRGVKIEVLIEFLKHTLAPENPKYLNSGTFSPKITYTIPHHWKTILNMESKVSTFRSTEPLTGRNQML